MSLDEVQTEIGERITEEWLKMLEMGEIPPLYRDDGALELDTSRMDEMSARDWSIHDAGVIRGLMIASKIARRQRDE